MDASFTEKALQLVTESLEVSETIDYCDQTTNTSTSKRRSAYTQARVAS